MKRQLWFQTDLGYQATKEVILKSRKIGTDGDDYQGRFTFRLKNFKDATIQITTKSKLSISYPEEINYNTILKELLPLLVKADNTPAKLTSKIRMLNRSREVPSSVQNIEGIIEKLRFQHMRNPTLLEIAYAVGQPPEEIRPAAFALAPKIGWREPSKEQISEAEDKIKEVYELACLYKYFGNKVVLQPLGYLAREASGNVVERIKYTLQFEKDQLPEFVVVNDEEKRVEFEFRWPRNSKWYGYGDYTQYYYKDCGKVSQKMMPDVLRLKENVKELLKKPDPSKEG